MVQVLIPGRQAARRAGPARHNLTAAAGSGNYVQTIETV